MVKKSILFFLMCLFFRHISLCQVPIIKVDINVYDRPETEVNEPEYSPWPIPNMFDQSINIDGVRISLSGSFATGWYKAGIQAPYYARLANDGIKSGGYICLTFSGLPDGQHSLLTFHNTYSSPETNTFSPIDIYLNNELKYNNLIPTNRVLSNEDATTAYFNFEVIDGEDVLFYFYPDTNSTANNIIATLCGFELNTPNAKYQAKYPIPENGDEHVPFSDNEITLKWRPSDFAASHNVYFGENYQSVYLATTDSVTYKGNYTDTTFMVEDLYNLKKYYWRIDEIDSSGHSTRGDIWYFKPAHLAFPGAEGYGRFAIGGRGGKVVEVTNLNDSGPGSLREAITKDIGPRTIVFNVSGIISLESRLTINSDYITIAGQTAPGKGICIRKAPMGMSGASDVIMRHMRVRLGSGQTYDGMGMAGSNYSIIDHCSISWTIDEAFSSRSAKNISLQRTLISEALNVANHQNYPYGAMHGYAASIGGDIGSFHHNLLAHCSGRNWSLAGGLDGNGDFAGRLDIFNNLVYNWYSRVTDGGAHEVNFVNNYYKRGPASRSNIDYVLKAQYEEFPGSQQYYFSGNVMPGIFDESNQTDGRIYSGEPHGYLPWVDSAFFPSYAFIHTAQDAYKQILSDVGATQPVFDDHDKRMIQETLEGSFTYRGSYTNLPGIPDSQEDVGGWEEYPKYQRDEIWDSDHDGMPDWWENAKGIDPYSTIQDFSEANSDPNKDGYTQLEEYLNWMAEIHFFISKDSILSVNLKDYSQGFSNLPVFTISEVINGSVIQTDNQPNIKFKAASEGFASLSFIVSDNDGSSMNKSIHFFIGDVPKDKLLNQNSVPVDTTGNDTKLKENSIYSFKTFPSISTDMIYLENANKIHDNIKFQIFDALGRKITSEVRIPANVSCYPIFINNLNPGLYFINLYKNREYLQTLKFIKY